MSQEAPHISIIIPAHNSSHTLGDCLDALASQKTDRPLEVIVVDDGSTDSTREVAAKRGVKVLSQKHSSPAAARNLGAREARGDILLFLDSDCMPQQDWVERMLDPLQVQEVVGVKGAYLTHQPGLIPQFIQAEFEEKYRRMRAERYIDFIDTYSAAYRKRVFLGLGGFHPGFPACSAEDAEFSFRLAEKGYKMVFAPQARVYHQHPERMLDYLWRKFRYGYWRARVYSRYPGKLIRDSYTPGGMKLQIALSALSLVALALALLSPLSLGFLAAILLAYGASTIPFVRGVSRESREVAALAPLLLYLRSMAQAVGLVVGGLVSLVRSLPFLPWKDSLLPRGMPLHPGGQREG